MHTKDIKIQLKRANIYRINDMSLSEDVMNYIYKLYYTTNIICDLPNVAEVFALRRYFKSNVIEQMLYYSTGDYVSKLINKFINDKPNNFYVKNWSLQYWDTIYYMIVSRHVSKNVDIFLFDNLIDVMHNLRFTT